MKLQTALSQPHQLVDQPIHWPLFYLLPQTHYVKRQRAANSPEYSPMPKAEVSHYEATSRKRSHLQRGINRLTDARNKAWSSLKHFGREVVHAIVKWYLLPLAVAASLSMAYVSPAELSVDYYGIDEAVVMEQKP